MWKAQAGQAAPTKSAAASGGDDEWETDPDFVNDVSEKEQRWGAKTVEGSGRKGSVNLEDLRQGVLGDHAEEKKKQLETGPKASFGYGGKFGVQKDRMDEGAVGHDYVAKTEKHSSQKDYSQGFGGKYGVMKDRVDKSAMGYEHVEQVGKHSSQTDYSHGFGGKYGVDSKPVDRAAVGFDHREEVEKHSSQTDYSKGFGGKYGVERDRVDKSAHGFQHVEQVGKHSSQKDYAVGFGGKFGVQGDRQDASAKGFDEPSKEHVASKSEEGTRQGTGLVKGQAKLLRDKFEAGPVAPAFQAPVHKAKMSVPAPAKAAPAEANYSENQPWRELPPTNTDAYSTVAACVGETVEQQAQSVILEPEHADADNVYEEVGEIRAEEPVYEDLPLTATALYDYDAVDQDEISFLPGDVITDIEQIDEGWWRGTCHGHSGLFPSNYVQLNS